MGFSIHAFAVGLAYRGTCTQPIVENQGGFCGSNSGQYSSSNECASAGGGEEKNEGCGGLGGIGVEGLCSGLSILILVGVLLLVARGKLQGETLGGGDGGEADESKTGDKSHFQGHSRLRDEGSQGSTVGFCDDISIKRRVEGMSG